jgi:hypothetical protein
MSNEFQIPDGLSAKGRKAAETLVKLAGKGADGGGCRAFYTPEEWADRGEQYGLKSLLIICHDGGDLAPFLNWDYCAYAKTEKAITALSEHGVYAEQCTGWYTAIYEG